MDGTFVVCLNHEPFVFNMPIERYLNALALNRLSTYQASVKAARKYLKIKHKVPIYLGSELILLQLKGIRAENTFLVNRTNILDFTKFNDHEVLIRFKSGHIIRHTGYLPFLRQWRLSSMLENHLAETKDKKKMFTSIK
jgi:hypothetical protein